MKQGLKNNQENSRVRKTFKSGLLRYVRDCCGTTSIHGLVHFSENRAWFEYVWWLIVFTLSVCGSLYMIHGIYMKWLQSPVIVSFATKRKSVYSLPFPAITICPMNKLNKTFFNFTQYVTGGFHTFTNINITQMDKLAMYMDLVCLDKYTNSTVDFIDTEDFFSVLQNHSVDIKSNGRIYLENKLMEFSTVLKETYTQQGLCYSYNRLNLHEIYSDIVVRNEQGFEDFDSSNWDIGGHEYRGGPLALGYTSYPRRVGATGINNGLFIMLVEEEKNNDIYCQSFWQGYAVTLHHPSTMPSTGYDFFILPADEFVAVPIEASVIVTSEAVANYSPHKRDCYFPLEKQLRYFNIYTRANCDLECATNITLKSCGCVQFYMPREKETRVCGPGKMDCVSDALSRLRESIIERSMKEEYTSGEGENEGRTDNGLGQCNCLAMCNDIAYKAGFEPYNIKPQRLINLKKKLHQDYKVPLDKDHQMSTIVLYFKEDRVSTTERNELYGPTDFISNFGGLLGLFMGFSILSGIEILYFLTIRILGNIHMFRHWAGPRP